MKVQKKVIILLAIIVVAFLFLVLVPVETQDYLAVTKAGRGSIHTTVPASFVIFGCGVIYNTTTSWNGGYSAASSVAIEWSCGFPGYFRVG